MSAALIRIAARLRPLAAAAAILAAGTAFAQDKDAASPVKVDRDGTVHVSELKVPPSIYMSEDARKSFAASGAPASNPAWTDVNAPIAKLRQLSEGPARMGVAFARKQFAVDIADRTIGGVHVRIVTPKGGVAARNRDRVLIELHGGGFFTGAEGQALLDSIPVAAAGWQVIAVDYRQGPENRYPAATEDVAAVYRELLKTHRAGRIGIYGSSTGGSLTAMAVAWFQKEKLPRPGAIGIFSGGAYAGFENDPGSPGAWGGDSRYVGPPLGGEPLWPIDRTKVSLPAATEAYLKGADVAGPLASPALHPAVLAQFPPTLILSGTRSFGMSAAIQTHREMVKAGVDADLHLWDGQGHCFYYDFSLPESREAVALIARFFDSHLQP